MKTKAWILTAITTFCSVTMSGQVAPRGNLPHYTVIDLGNFGTAFATAQGINNKGSVDGIFGNQNQHEFVFRNGVVTDLGTLGGPNSGVGSFGQMPSERGQIVGAAESSSVDPLAEGFCNFLLFSPITNNVCLPFLWQNGVMAPLPTLGGTNGGASQINNRGQIAGTAENTTLDSSCGVPHLNTGPVIWEKGVIHQLPTVGGDPGGGVDSINDKGQAVGATGNCSAASHAVLWQDGMATDLGNLGGTPPGFFEATSINNESQVVGFSDLPGNTTFHAFFWQDGVISDLGTLPGDSASFASAINSKGQVVGTSCVDTTFASCRAFLWQDRVMTDLNTLIPPNSPFLVQAIGINDRGQITGFTADVHAYLATPCDEEHANNVGCNDGAEGKSTATQKRNLVLPENVRNMLRQRLGHYHKPSLKAPTD